MNSSQSTNSNRPRGKEPWRLERAIQRAPLHLGEERQFRVQQWMVIAGAALVLVIVVAALLFWLGGLNSDRSALQAPTTTRVAPQNTPTDVPNPTAVATDVPTLAPIPSDTPAPATVTATKPVPSPTASYVKYRVRSGDTLTSIAEKYRVTVKSIIAMNGLKGETIHPGDELLIPLPVRH